MGKATGFIEIQRKKHADARRSPSACTTGARSICRIPTPALKDQAARCMDCGIPFCHQRLPARQPDPRLERSRLPRPLAGGDRSAARDEQLPGVHRPPVPGAVRGLVRARHQQRPGDDQGGRGLDHRSRVRGGLGRAAAAGVAHRQARRRRRLRARRAWPRPTQLNRAGHSVTVFERADRIGGLLRYGIPEFKMEKRRPRSPARRCWRGRRHVPHQRQRRRRRARSTSCAREFDAIVLAGGSTRPRDLPVPGRELDGIHFAMEYLTLQNRRNEGDDVAGRPTFITAKDKHVIIIGGGDTGADCLGTAHRQGARRVHQLELLPRPPDDARADNPWPLWPNIFRVSSAHEEGRRAALRDRRRSSSRATRRARARRCTRSAGRDGAARTAALEFKPVAGQRVRAQGRPGAAGDGLPRPRAQRHARRARREDDRARQRVARRAAG